MRPFSWCESVVAVVLTSTLAIILVLWALSYWHTIVIGWETSRDYTVAREQTFRGLYVQRGRVGTGTSMVQLDPAQRLPAAFARPRWEDGRFVFVIYEPERMPWMVRFGRTHRDSFRWAGFEHVHSTAKSAFTVLTSRAILVPWWAVFLPALMITLRWTFFRERRLLWRKRNRCVVCGYDLRESPDRCPECGQPITANTP